MTVIASFLAGSLLSLLLPTLMLIALVIWYVRFVSKVPETAPLDQPERRDVNASATEGPELSHTSDHLG
jgi:hypothetical protein